jgi:hypothetical protein
MAHGLALRCETRRSCARRGPRSTLVVALVVLLGAGGCGDDEAKTTSTGATKGESRAPSEGGATRGRPASPASPVRAGGSATSGSSAGKGRSGSSTDTGSSAAHGGADDPGKGADAGDSASTGRSVDRGRSNAPGGSATGSEPADPGRPTDHVSPNGSAAPADPGSSVNQGNADGPSRTPSDDVAVSNEVQLSDMGLGDPAEEPVANSPLAFDGLRVGESRTYAITIRNTGIERTIATVSIRATGSGDEFRLAGGSCAKTVLKSDETCRVRVTYTPTASGSHRAVLEIGVRPCRSPTTDATAPESCTHRTELVGKTRG